ncbi:hypothetical protein B0H13DRAFT_2408661 [Mycena leptocephala]|nr:hypothetical protein B0H13DRAFT_2408661 [Mycena leptocephala]
MYGQERIRSGGAGNERNAGGGGERARCGRRRGTSAMPERGGDRGRAHVGGRHPAFQRRPGAAAAERRGRRQKQGIGEAWKGTWAAGASRGATGASGSAPAVKCTDQWRARRRLIRLPGKHNEQWADLSPLASIPRLSHLSFSDDFLSGRSLFNIILEHCKSLQVLAMLFADLSIYKFTTLVLRNQHSHYPDFDPRVVFLVVRDRQADWETDLAPGDLTEAEVEALRLCGDSSSEYLRPWSGTYAANHFQKLVEVNLVERQGSRKGFAADWRPMQILAYDVELEKIGRFARYIYRLIFHGWFNLPQMVWNRREATYDPLDLDCWVEVDGVKLSEYSLEYSVDGMEVICWIPSEVDKKFSIHWVDSKASLTRRTYGFVAVDGIDCPGQELSLVRTGIRWVGTGHRDSVDTSSMTRRSLLFGRQQLTDDDRFLDAPISPNLGTITLELVDGVECRTLPRFPQFVTLPSQKLHERSKKAIGHSVQFVLVSYIPLPIHTTVEVLECLAKFTFKYRPLDLLKANGIIPADKLRPGPAIEVPTTRTKKR